jgi:hypothetical protein
MVRHDNQADTDASTVKSVSNVSRRQMLARAGCGFGWLAFADLLSRRTAFASTPEFASSDGGNSGLHHRPSAKRVIFLFMHGGPSHVDTFDYKPLLTRDDGKSFSGKIPSSIDAVPKLLGSPWKFKQHGESGLWVSDLFPEVAKVSDRLCVIRSMHSRGQSHGQAVSMIHTGSDNLIRPSVGSWVSYGLGTENDSLPAFVSISPATAHGGPRNYGSSFLPAHHQATVIGSNGKLREARIANLQSKETTPFTNAGVRPAKLDLIQQLNQRHLDSAGSDPDIEGIIESYELAFRMQRFAPEVLNLGAEPDHVNRLYGIDKPATADFGRQCLLARRMIESGVRFVQLSSGNVWDQHSDLFNGHTKNALATDRPIAGLIQDLAQRGLLDDTLVVWGGEFGRTPIMQGKNGRDHNPQGFTMWMCGGGLRGGIAYGETDEHGYYAVHNRVHMHDLHATMLHLLGIDHERLTFPYAGREFRLTDVHGRVVREIIA